jgi:hypothetical protein
LLNQLGILIKDLFVACTALSNLWDCVPKSSYGSREPGKHRLHEYHLLIVRTKYQRTSENKSESGENSILNRQGRCGLTWFFGV